MSDAIAHLRHQVPAFMHQATQNAANAFKSRFGAEEAPDYGHRHQHKPTPSLEGFSLANLNGPAGADTADHIFRKALKGIQRDIGQMLRRVGFDGDKAKDFAKAFVKPALAALQKGVDFSAKMTVVAARSELLISGGSLSQSQSLFAKSIEIDINQSSGEVSVNMESVSLSSSVSISGPGFSLAELPQGISAFADLLPKPGETITDLNTLLLEALGEAVDPGEVDENAATPVPIESIEPPEPEASADTEETEEATTAPEVPAEPAEEVEDGAVSATREATESLSFSTRFYVESVSAFQNDIGQQITRIRLDAAISLNLALTQNESPFGQAAPNTPVMPEVLNLAS